MTIPRFVIIGGGAMGSAMLAAIRRKSIFPISACAVIEHSASRRAFLRRTFRVRAEAMAEDVIGAETSVVVLAVKPQDAKSVMAELNGVLPHRVLVVSIMAGVSTKTLRRALAHSRIVRAMPNMPAQIGLGMTVWTSTRGVAAEDRRQARNIFGALGDELYVKNENLIDAATAVSGSGPAYVFAFAKAFLAAARRLGFPKRDALRLVRQTLVGSAALFAGSGKDPGELRRQVTSKNGTTEAALRVLERANLERILPTALRAAYRRAKEISHALD